MTTLAAILLSFAINPSPSIALAPPEWAFILPATTEAEPSPPVDDFLAELDREFWGGVANPFAAGEHFVDPFDNSEPYRREVLEAQAALELNALQDQLDDLGR
jgi:hypothetical protein